MKKNVYLCSAIVILLLMVSQILYAQSSGENYITTETFLDSLGTKKVTSVQYYDGLGRPNVLATNGLSPNGKYVYTMTEYDSLGREAKTWLPAVGTTSPNFISTSTMSINSQNTYGGDAYAFSETTYDAIGRPTFVSTPGEAWHQNNKGVTTEYKTNAANSVKRYVVTSPTTCTFTQQGYYAPATLTCVKTTDEDGRKIEIYKDFMDKVVLERRAGGNDTYYLYYKGLLCVVLPPLYQTTESYQLIYQYKYDSYGRLAEKILPECSPMRYYYDKYGRLSFMTDGTMSGNSCRFYLYDQLNRLVVQGFCSGKNINPTTSLPATAVYGTGDTEITGTGYYISSSYALVNPTIEIVNYYDNYQFLTHPALQDSIGNVSLSRTGHANATSFQTGQLVKTSNGRYLCTALYYNQKGQVVETCENTLNGVIHNTATTYTFTGKPSTINESVTKNTTTRAVVQQNTYNTNTDQLLSRTHKFRDATAVNTGSYAYDDLGRLDSISRYLDRTSVRYTYNLHGWLTNIHGHDHYHNQLLFNEKLHYTDGSRTPYYNGNISCAKYITPDYPMGQGNQCVYEYTYDGMNRLTFALFGYGPENSNNNMFTAYFSESMTYDANSNIQSLTRYGKMNNGNYNAIDVLDYTYDGGNRLYSIIDHGQNLVTEGAFDFKDDLIDSFYAPEYWYNSNGALSYDANKGVSWIDYDRVGNPIRVQFTDHSITEHVYAADGRRLKTIHRTSIPQSTPLGIGVTAALPSSQTQSIDSVDYVGSFIYEKGQLKRYMFDDGYLKLYTNTFSPRFFIKDHLGNNRIVTDGSGNIQQNTNYYPYGGMTSISTGQGEQQFKYNGKEYDPMHGLNEYDYGARQYDPARGQFTTMDPLCEKYYHISPYAYCGGNPVNRVDVDGDSIYFGPLLQQDHDKKRDTAQMILQDLKDFTGLNLYFSSNGYLLYNKEQYSECGSKIARNFLISAIDNPVTICIGDNGELSLFDKINMGIGICDSQISGYRNNTPGGLDDRTLGYGMVFLHELAHSPIGGSKKDPYEPLEYVQGKTVQFINSIRKELDDNPLFNKKGYFGIRLSYGIVSQFNGQTGIPFAVPNKKESIFINTSIF